VQEVYKTLPWVENDDKTKIAKVLETFERFCSPQKNILCERYGFWTLHQEENEPTNACLTRLKLKINLCVYDKGGWTPAIESKLTQDQFIFSLRDDALKE